MRPFPLQADNGHEELHETEAELGLKNNEEEVPSSAGDRRDETDGDNNSATAVVADGVSTATNRSGTASSSSSSVGNDVERGLEGSGGNTAASGGGSSGGGSGSGGGSSLSDDPASKSGKLKAVYSPTVAQFGSFATQIALFCRKDWGVLTQVRCVCMQAMRAVYARKKRFPLIFHPTAHFTEYRYRLVPPY